MKRLIVLSALLLAATFNFTSCGDKKAQPEPTENVADSLSQTEADTTTQVVTDTVADTIVEKK